MCLLYINKKENKQSIKKLLILICAYLLIGIIQWIEYNNISIRCFREIPLLMISGFYVMDKLGERFKYAYMNIMCVIACVSLFFMLL